MASRDRLEAASECIKPGIVAQAVRCLRPVVAPAVVPGAPGPGHATAAVKYGCSDADVSRSAPLDSCRRRTRFGLWYPCPPCLLASLPPRLAPATPVSSPAASARRCSAAWSRRAGVDVERQREEGHEAGDDYLGRGKQSEGTRRRKWIALWEGAAVGKDGGDAGLAAASDGADPIPVPPRHALWPWGRRRRRAATPEGSGPGCPAPRKGCVIGVRTTAGGVNDATERVHRVYAVLLVGWS